MFLAVLFCAAVVSLSGTVWLYLGTTLLKVPPLEIQIGLGPKVGEFQLSGIDVVVHAIPLGSSASYRKGAAVSEVLPGFAKRAIAWC